MALLEAAAAGTPVISTKSCGVAELIEDGKTGRLVPVDNPSALAEAISSLLENPVLADQMAKRLQDRVGKEFTWDQACQKYLQLVNGSGFDCKDMDHLKTVDFRRDNH